MSACLTVVVRNPLVGVLHTCIWQETLFEAIGGSTVWLDMASVLYDQLTNQIQIQIARRLQFNLTVQGIVSEIKGAPS